MLRLRGTETEPKLYTVAAAARELGISAQTLRWLESRSIVKPLRVHDTAARGIRVFREADIQRVLEHYAQVGGVRGLREK